MPHFITPNKFSVNAVPEFLDRAEVYLKNKKMGIENFILDLSTIRKINPLGLLLIYKFIEYTATHKKFSNPKLITNEEIIEEWKKYEFKDLIESYLTNSKEINKYYQKLRVNVKNDILIAPQPLLREGDFSEISLKSNYLPKIKEFFQNDEKKLKLFFTCFSEIVLNFWEHAVNDTKSIILANGNQDQIEIICADTGDGIISSLKKSGYIKIKDEVLIKKAFEKGVSSKKGSNHMGYGLWIILELIKANRSRLHVYSEGFYYFFNYEKESVGKCGYWPGTIIYVCLKLTKPMTISDVLKKANNNLKINFI